MYAASLALFSFPIVPVPPSKGSTLTCSTGYCSKRQQTVARPMPHLYSVRTSLPLAQKFCSFFSIPALLVVLAAGSRIAVCPAASTFVFPKCQRTNYKSTRGGLLARRIALPELKPCAADVIETSLGGRTPAAYPAILTNRTGNILIL